MKQSFILDDIELSVNTSHLTPAIIKSLNTGRFERPERAAIKKNLRPGDRVLDLGGGIGCTGVVAGRIVGGESLMIVEANADLLADIAENLAANLIFGAKLLHGAIVAEKTTETISFFKSKGFWAGSLLENNAPNTQKVDVPVFDFQTVVMDFMPTVIICDIEGLEVELFKSRLPDTVRLILLELHPNLYGQDAIKTLFDELSENGFSYLPHGSNGAVICLVK